MNSSQIIALRMAVLPLLLVCHISGCQGPSSLMESTKKAQPNVAKKTDEENARTTVRKLQSLIDADFEKRTLSSKGSVFTSTDRFSNRIIEVANISRGLDVTIIVSIKSRPSNAVQEFQWVNLCVIALYPKRYLPILQWWGEAAGDSLIRGKQRNRFKDGTVATVESISADNGALVLLHLKK